jgi:hypothetical protein
MGWKEGHMHATLDTVTKGIILHVHSKFGQKKAWLQSWVLFVQNLFQLLEHLARKKRSAQGVWLSGSLKFWGTLAHQIGPHANSPFLSEEGVEQLIANTKRIFEPVQQGQHEHRSPLTYLLTCDMLESDALSLGVGNLAYLRKARQTWKEGRISDSPLFADKAVSAKRPRREEEKVQAEAYI